MIVFLLVLGMCLVTMIPRIIPVFIVDRIQFPNWVSSWLKGVPYAALGALIFPGILSVQKGNMSVGLIGGLVAILLSLLRLHIIFVVFGAIGTVLVMKLYFI
ncbi:AzlD domain-containing protein [Gottfriedia acidiceleris]|uniref:AzlD domain-containing protein n=1 Tax=Gottfriedia acidiceleris TaxID=371036 RepID=UPI000B43C2EE|nr:AzlD domain-containing protein [Gottfriedia acidiceleris]